VSHMRRTSVQEGAETVGFPAQGLWDSAQELWDLTHTQRRLEPELFS